MECLIVMTITSLLSFAYFIHYSGSFFTISDDFMLQQIPFTIALRNALQHGFDTWSWNTDLGCSTIQAYSFYEMGSPFFYLTYLVPAAKFPAIVGWIYCLKYIVAGMTAWYYLKVFVRNPRYAVLGGLLYAFSGFQATNLLFYHFHDVVAFFPLLLAGLERMMKDRRKFGLFIFAVFLNCICNYFFFIQEVVFLVLYYCVRFHIQLSRTSKGREIVGAELAKENNGKAVQCKESGKSFSRDLLRCLGYGSLGVGMAAVLFLPSVLYIAGNPRAHAGLPDFFFSPDEFLKILVGILLPGEPMTDHSVIRQRYFSSTACFLPFVSISLVISYLLQKKNTWLKTLLIILFVMSCSPLLNAAFLLFTASYQRWWFMLTLMMALASVLVLEEPENYRTGWGTLITLVMTGGIYLGLSFVPQREGTEPLVLNADRFLLIFAFSAAGVILLQVFLMWHQTSAQLLIPVTMLSCILTMAGTLHYYRAEYHKKLWDYRKTYAFANVLQEYDDQYRFLTYDNDAPITYIAGIAGTGAFTSTKAQSIYEFYGLFDYDNWTKSLMNASVPYLNRESNRTMNRTEQSVQWNETK